MRQHKVNEPFQIKIDTRLSCFNSEDKFKLYYFTDEEKIIKEKENVVFEELLSGSIVKSFNILESEHIGSKSIVVDENHNFELDELVKIKNNFYFISDINNNTIYLNKMLKTDVDVDDVISYSNLTGLYVADVMFDSVGMYNIVIKNTKTYNSMITNVQIVNELIGDKIDKIMNSKTDKTFI